MPKPVTRLDYARRIERVAAFVSEHLDAPLNLAQLAEVACLSPYHFHRIYRALTGETVAETVRRRRLHRAAGELVHGDAPIAAVAARAGYGSAAEIGEAFERICAWAAGHDLMLPETQTVGIYYDDPEAVPAEELRSAAGVTVPEDLEPDGPVAVAELAGGRHAVVLHKGPYAELERAYRFLYKDWLPQSGEEPADRPCYEVYLNDPRRLPPAEWLTEIRLPLTDASPRDRSARAA